MNVKSAPAMLAAALVAVLVAACGGTASHNDADVAFVTGMIPHHTQAVAMSALAADRSAAPQVKALATAISGAQQPEIAQMQGFLSSWGQPTAPTTSSGGMSGMSGMMTDGQMRQLTASSGAAFDRMFLQMMTQHHNGAIEMADVELRAGQSTDAKALAQKIIDAQRVEIATMKQLLTAV